MEKLLIVGLLMLLAAAAHTKDTRTYYDEPTMARVREKIEKFDWARAQVAAAENACAWLLEMSDEELWQFIPPPEQLRSINVHIAHDCPTCGDEVNRKAGHYPWITSREKPFKLECPVCHGVFPSNDFEPWNTQGLEGKPETGPEPVDKGLGWVGPDGRRYYFVPYYIFWQRWVRDILGGMQDLSRAYVLTDDPRYAHKCAVMLSKIAQEYPRFDYSSQCYHEGRFGVSGRISDHIWSTGDDSKMTLAYDAVFPVFSRDEELATFLKGKGIQAPRQLIETNLLNTMARDVMTGYVAGNMGMHQKTLCELAIVLDNEDPERGPTTEEMRKWLMSGPGRVEDLLWNGFWREGLGAESAPGYASGWCVNFYEIAALLPRLGEDIWSNPKLKKMADVGLDLTVAGWFCPSIGDCGGFAGTWRVGWSAVLQGRAFTHYGDVRHAKALALMKAQSRDLFDDYFDEEQVARTVAGHGSEIESRTRCLGGYGVALLESGEGDNRRAVSMYFGDAGGGHGHYDRLNIEMFSHGMPVLPDDGYPTPFTRPDFHEWRRADTHKHYCVMVDERPQMSLAAGDLNTLASAPTVHLMDASAEAAYPGDVSLYRRTTALIDISAEDSYLLDIFRVRGGRQHDWCFHGPPMPEFSISGGQPGTVQEKGTLAGEDVPYGAKPPTPLDKMGISLDLANAPAIQTGAHYSKLAPNGWARQGRGALTQKMGVPLTVKTARIEPGKVRVFMRVWDYNAGVNEVDVTLGPVTRTFRTEPSGAAGYRWISEICELPEAVDEVTVTARSMGQSWVTIDAVVISRNLDAGEPPEDVKVSSGFQGLFNVQRMEPDGAWSASWRDPEKDLSVTMTMPGGCTRQVIIADGEPEAQHNAPDTIKYVLGRNTAAAASEDLLSRYVSVIEPHKGAPAVSGVDLLEPVGEAPGQETLAVAVRRGNVTDLIHSSPDPSETVQWRFGDNTLKVAGEFALLTVDDSNTLIRAFVTNGSLLSYGDFVLEPEPSPQGKVIAVDHERNGITIDRPLPDPDAYRGSAVILGNELSRTSYMIEQVRVENGRTTLGFGDTLFILGMGAVAGVDDSSGVVVSDRQLAGYGRIEGGRHEGRWLYNEDKSRGLRITAVNGSKLQLENAGGALDSIFTDADGDGRKLYWISDIGPGDSWYIPATAYVDRAGQ